MIYMLEILNKPLCVTKATIKFDGDSYENVKWEISGNILYFSGDKIKYDDAWNFIKRNDLSKIEDKYIREFSERYGFLWLKKRTYKGVSGPFVYKKRKHLKIKTNQWVIVDHTSKESGGSNVKQRSNS